MQNSVSQIKDQEFDVLWDILNSNVNTPRNFKDMVLERAGKEVYDFIAPQIDLDFDNTYFLASSDCFDIYKLNNDAHKHIINFTRVNNKRRVNKFFEAVNQKLPLGGKYIASVETYSNRRKRLMSKFIFPINTMIFGLDAIFHRVFPKLRWTQRLYFYLTKGKDRLLSRAETLGRLYSCGFEVLEEKEINNCLYFVARKTGRPTFDYNPTYGPLIKLKRVGKNEELFNVYKLRTMYPFAEYLQDYVYRKNQLSVGGKFKDDFRVSPLGKFFRKFWLDELPMIFNLLKGDMKLIGVRPLSQHYFSLYTKELQDIRCQTRPGLIPPFYADLPKTLDEIMESEMKYLQAYKQNPLATDIKYFLLIIKNILFVGVRGK